MKHNNRLVLYNCKSGVLTIYEGRKSLGSFIFVPDQGVTLVEAIEQARTLDIKEDN